MKQILFVFLSVSALFGASVWTPETPALSQKQLEAIIRHYDTNSSEAITFEDDSAESELPFVENIVILGLGVGMHSYDETIANATGSKTNTFTGSDVTFVLAKEFTFWHEKYAQLSRLYFTYGYSYVDSKSNITTYAFGLQENMKYFSVYETPSSMLYPTLFFEFHKSSMTRNAVASDGFGYAMGMGMTWAYKHSFEYTLKIARSNTGFEYLLEGISDDVSAVFVGFELVYKINYGEF